MRTANLIPEFFRENLLRGKGILVKSILNCQRASPKLSSLYASLICVINSKIPEIGELLLKRLINNFQIEFKRNNKDSCVTCALFLAHLINQQVASELIGLQILALLLEKPTKESIEISFHFVRECGMYLSEINPKPFNDVFDAFRNILQEGEIDKRTQYFIEQLFQIRKSKFKDFPIVVPQLDLVEEDDKLTHQHLTLSNSYDPLLSLDNFQFDKNFKENNQTWSSLKNKILGFFSNQIELIN